MKNQKEVQIKISSKNKVKPPLLKSIYSQEVKNGRIDNNEVKIITTYEDMDSSKTDYSKLVYRSGTMSLLILLLSSFYLKLIDGRKHWH